MGDNSSSTENGRFRLKEWLRGGFWQGRSGNTQQPARSTAHSSESSDKENEELDDETAPYLSDDPRNPNGRNRRTEKDLRKDDSRGGTNRVCAGCKRYIGSEAYLGRMGTFFHHKCFLCRACGHPITENEFSLSGSNETYHKSCFKQLTHKCDVCYQFIPLNKNGLIEFRGHPFWLQKYCPLHELDNTSCCCCCERLEPWNIAYITLRDGRKLCLECKESAVMDTGESLVLYHAVRDFFEGLYMKLDQQIPMLLVERQALNETIVGEKTGHRHMPETRGLCLSKEQTVSIISKRPEIIDPRVIGMKRQPLRLIRECEVTAILILYGLPRLLTGAILAQELMRGWLRLNGFRALTPEVEEGICKVLSHLWLESEVIPGSNRCTRVTHMASSSSLTSSKKGAKSDVEKKLGEFFMHQIANDASPTHGGGFRAANAAVNKYGLRRTIEHIRLTGNFPL